jgi:putative transposase
MTIERCHSSISISRQCELLGLPFSTLYYQPKETTEQNLMIMNAIDAVFTHSEVLAAKVCVQFTSQRHISQPG